MSGNLCQEKQGEKKQKGIRSCNVTKDILYWSHDQTIMDRI